MITKDAIELLKSESLTKGFKEKICTLANRTSDLCRTLALNPSNTIYLREAQEFLEDISIIQKELENL